MGPEWKVFEETRIARSGLVLCPMSPAKTDQQGRRQPDWMLVSEEHKKIAIVDLCRPSDVLHAQLLAAATRKQRTYCPLEEALGYYTEQGWVVHVFPCMAGISGMIHPSHVEISPEVSLHDDCIQRKHWRVAVD